MKLITNPTKKKPKSLMILLEQAKCSATKHFALIIKVEVY